MPSSLSKFVYNLSEGLHSDQCTYRKSYLDNVTTNNEQLIFSFFECKKNYKNIYEFCNEDINKFILLLRKGVYHYEYMDNLERFAETLLPDKEAFYSGLKKKDITDVDYRVAKRVLKNLNNKNLGDYHDLYVQSDTLLLADVFENFKKQMY